MGQRLPGLGQRIRELRTGRMTLSELAKQAGISKAYLSQIETGQVEKPSAQSLYQIAAALGTSVGVLLGAVSESSGDDVDIPPSLERFAQRADLTHEEKLMLARIRYRGQRPKTEDDWRYLLESIKRSAAGAS